MRDATELQSYYLPLSTSKSVLNSHEGFLIIHILIPALIIIL